MKPLLLDARGLLCPMPVIRVQNRVEEMAVGEELEAICSDPGVLHDIPSWCRVNGHELLACEERQGEYVVRIRVAGD
jgi:tRNA 2-thiouridine synthesizing protein A